MLNPIQTQRSTSQAGKTSLDIAYSINNIPIRLPKERWFHITENHDDLASYFHEILETRHGSESLHHAIESCHHAAQLEPWVVTNADLSGILANHRANMATHVSHARFYIGVLIKTLST